MTMDQSVPRDSRRVPLETRVHLKFERFTGFISEYSSNISPGGMFVTTQAPEPPGTMLEFQFQLGDGFELIRGTGEVVWVRTVDEGSSRPAGMGIRFLRLSRGSRDLIYKMVDTHISQGGTPFDLADGTPAAGAEPAVAAAPPAPPAATETPVPPEPDVPPEPEAPPVDPLGPLPTSLELPLEPPPSRPVPELSPEVEAFLAGGQALPEPEPAPPVRGAAVAQPLRTPRTRRPPRPWALAAAALLLVAGGAAVWLREPLLGLVGLGDESAAESRMTSPRPPPSRPARREAAPPGAPSSGAGADPASAAPATPVVTEEAVPAPVESAAAPPASAAATAATRPAREIQRITWREAGGETEVVLWGDGAIGAASYTRARVEGGPPRELLRLSGIERPFPSARLQPGTGHLRQIRTGWHPKPAADELHVVLDLADPAVVVSRVEERENRLHIHLGRP